MRKFAVGDTVRIVRSTYNASQLAAGKVGVVRSNYCWRGGRQLLGIEVSGDTARERLSFDGEGWAFYNDELEAVNE